MSRFPWFRLYSEIRTDPKLRSLPVAERWVWLMLLTVASENQERGVVPATPAHILAAAVADGDVGLLERAIADLVTWQLVERREDGGLVFRAWCKRQYPYPSDTPARHNERVQKSRAAKAAKNVETSGDERRRARDEPELELELDPRNSAPSSQNSRAPAREAATTTAGPSVEKFSEGADRGDPPDGEGGDPPPEPTLSEQELPAARRLLAGLALAEEPAALHAAAAVVAAAPAHDHDVHAACCAAWYRAHRRPLTVAAYWRWLEREPAPAVAQPPIARGGPWVQPAAPAASGPSPAASPPPAAPPPEPTPAPHAGGVWGAVLDDLEEQMVPTNFSRWLARTTLLGRGPGEIVVGVPDRVSADQLARRFDPLVRRAAADILGEPVTVRYEVLPCPT